MAASLGLSGQPQQEGRGVPISERARPLRETGKIYIKENLVFVNEQRQGIHVINNQNPAEPELIGFLDIPGNVDIAIRDNILFADSRYDLVVIDISEPTKAAEINRIKGIFPKEKPWRSPRGGCFPAWTPVLTAAGSQAIETIRPGTEVYGWDVNAKRWVLAKVLELQTHGYRADMITIELRKGAIRSTGNHPFYVLDGDRLSSRPAPRDLPAAERGMDRSGRWVEAGDISEIRNPKLIRTHRMHGPYGLGIDRGTLFICDGGEGLKLFDATDPEGQS